MSTWNKHYHWKTKNVTPWTKDYFRRNLVGSSKAVSSPSAGSVAIDSLSEFEGDVELGNRKGRLITIFDCQITLKWTGKLEDGTEAEGSILFPEVSHEVQDEEREYPFQASMSSSSSKETQALLDAVRAQLVPDLLPYFHKFRDELIAEHAKDVGHEGEAASASGSGTSTPAGAAGASNGAASSESGKTTPAGRASSSAGVPISTTKAEVSADLSIRREDLWDLLTNPGRIPMWSRAPAQLSLNPGANFQLFNGNVTGSVLQVEAPSKLVQKWRAPQWPANHYGTLTTSLVEGESSTKLTLQLEGVPLEEQERSQDALDRFYLAGLKGLGLGTGSLV